MLAAATILVLLTIILSGLYAGLALLCQIGVLPAMRKLTPAAFADTWRAMDSYLDRSMPPFKLSLIVVTAAAAVCVALLHRPVLAASLGISGLCSITGLVLTIAKQLPLNRELARDATNLSPERLGEILRTTTHNFSVRLVFAITAFLAAASGAMLCPLPFSLGS